MIYIYQHAVSEGARELAKLIGARRIIRGRPSIHRRKRLPFVINWGCSPEVDIIYEYCLNAPVWVALAHNKLSSFKLFKVKGISHPEWTTDLNVAKEWNKNHTIFVRTLLTSSQGKGIIVLEPGSKETVPTAPLYVKYQPKSKEFRVHVFNKQVIDVQEKRHHRGEKADNLVRSHNNGWLFARQDIVEPKELRSLAVDAVASCGIDFGAVDIIWSKKLDKCFVLEINTAPGLEGQTLSSYANAIKVFRRS